jgi:hypothetical protein
VTDLSRTMTRFRADLEGAAARDLDRRRRRARVTRALAGAVALAAVVGVLASTLLGGGGPSIVDRAEAALATLSGEPVHMVMVGRTTTADGRIVRWRDEEWLISGSIAPRRAVQTDADGHRFETAMTDDGLAELYDPRLEHDLRDAGGSSGRVTPGLEGRLG